jgi:hypothetical protein
MSRSLVSGGKNKRSGSGDIYQKCTQNKEEIFVYAKL